MDRGRDSHAVRGEARQPTRRGCEVGGAASRRLSPCSCSERQRASGRTSSPTPCRLDPPTASCRLVPPTFMTDQPVTLSRRTQGAHPARSVPSVGGRNATPAGAWSRSSHRGATAGCSECVSLRQRRLRHDARIMPAIGAPRRYLPGVSGLCSRPPTSAAGGRCRRASADALRRHGRVAAGRRRERRDRGDRRPVTRVQGGLAYRRRRETSS